MLRGMACGNLCFAHHKQPRHMLKPNLSRGLHQASVLEIVKTLNPKPWALNPMPYDRPRCRFDPKPFMARRFHGVVWADGTPSAPEKDGKDSSNSSNSNTCSDCSYHQNSTYDTNDAEVHKMK